ncbi:sodium/proline symporter PutP [Sporanaerobium hydrogeniformans]|uniref:Sodium/proline symporter PutP n=1 Tax=Sporanaerobium hydrogeniformans TaxID=3072179 RepID=A0AC61DF86_9FIRM|nr:sodium/proline symporter PutP [Sporanaerobium hydrogeniformans]PHV71592.1 sodium/proline symporter PutP [Sporanaerobium hydrogeniformans]
MDKNVMILITFILYLGIMLGIGWYFYFKTNNLSDYILGGRKLGKWVTSLSAQASDMSGWLLMGLPGAAYISGVSGAAWIAIGLAIGTYLNWKIVAQKLRIYTEKFNDSITLSSYFENRFDDKSKTLRIASSLFILIFFLVYTASGFVAGGKLLNSVFGMDYAWAVIIGAFVIISYTFLGGFLAVCWTDLIQGILMFIAIIILPIVVIVKAGGMGVITPNIQEGFFNLLNIEILSNGTGSISFVIVSILSSLAWGLGYFGQPHILCRFMAIEDPEEIKRSRHIAIGWVIISLAGAVFLGVLGSAVIEAGSIPNFDKEHIFITLVKEYAPLYLSGILLSAILAAIMSTADSQLLVTASAISEDLYRGVLKPKASEKELVWVSRLTVIIVAAIALCIALNPDSSVLDLVSYAWAGFGATFGPVVLLSLFWKKTTRNGAIIGMIAGGITTILWPLFQKVSGLENIALFRLYEIVPGFLVAIVCIFVVSKLEKTQMQVMEKYVEHMK